MPTIDLYKKHASGAFSLVTDWIIEYDIRILNVAGPRASKDPKIYQKTMDIIENVHNLCLAHGNVQEAPEMPKNVWEAVDRLISELSHKQKTEIANMTFENLGALHFSLGAYIRSNYGLWNQPFKGSTFTFSYLR
jgi:hypothetical protein